jgi:RNA polymerase sigma factor FliA
MNALYDARGRTGRDRMLAEHAPMVRRIAHQMMTRLPPSVQVDDLVQAGMIGLLDALERYETVEGAQFATYAAQRVRGAMLDQLRAADWMPRGARQAMRRVEAAIRALQQRLGRAPAEREVAAELQLSAEAYHALLQEAVGHRLVHYEDLNGPDAQENFLDRHCPDASSDPLRELLDGEFRGALVEAIDALPERERLLMGLYYEEDLNLKEIGAVMGVSESRVCQLHSQAVARIRARLAERELTRA